MSIADRQKLGSLCSVVTKGTTPTSLGMKFEDSGVPFLRIQNLNNSTVNLEDVLFISEETHDALERSKIRAGDFLITIAGTIGRVVIVPDEFPEANCNQAVAILRFDQSKLSPRFLLHWLSTNDAMRQISGKKVTATISNLSLGQIKELEIPLPPLEEQKRIAAILDKADSVRRKRQQAIDLADDFLRSVFLDMFGDPVINPKGWEVKKFGTVIDVLTDYHANGSYKTLNENVTLLDEPNYAYMVRTTDLEKKNYTDNVKYIDQHAYEHLSKTKVYGGELVINKIGSAGAVYLMPYLHRPVSLAMNQFMIRCNEHCLNEFVYYQLKTNAGARELEKRVQGAVTKTITKDAVRDIPIILPPIELQRQFIDVVEKINKLKTNTDNSSDLIRAKFNSISQKAFAGEL